MRKSLRYKVACLIGTVAMGAACGGSSPTPARKTLTPEEGQAIRAAAVQKANEELAQTFPDKKPAINKKLDEVDAALKGADLTAAARLIAELNSELVRVFESPIATSPDVAAMRERLTRQTRDLNDAKAAAEKRKAGVHLVATVVFTGTQFKITNQGKEDWLDVKFDLNGGLISSGYVYRADRVQAGHAVTIGAMAFADTDGTRFNPFQKKPQKMAITCALKDGASGITIVNWR